MGDEDLLSGGTDAGAEGEEGQAGGEGAQGSEGEGGGEGTGTGEGTGEGTGSEGEGGAEGEGGEEGEGESEGAPEEYAEFQMPEGITVDETMLAEFTPLAKECNFSQEQAQKFVDLVAKSREADAQAMTDALQDTADKWVEEITNDKEFGGGKFDENKGFANKALDVFGDEALLKTLKETGMCNNPDLFKAFVRAGKAIGEEKGVLRGGNQGGGEEKPRYERMYSGDNKDT